jgi:hypothetical protein
MLLTHARLMRNDMFAPLLPGAKPRAGHFPLTTVEALATLEPGKEVYICGMITQPEDGLWCLEDTQKAVAIDLSGASLTPGFFTETCIVLAMGTYDPDATGSREDPGHFVMAPPSVASQLGASQQTTSRTVPSASAPMPGAPKRFVDLTDGRLPGMLRVSFLGHPPCEPRSQTLSAMSVVDPFNIIHTPAEFLKVKDLEEAASTKDSMIVICSNIYLDVPDTMVALRKMFEGFDSCGTVPAMFVFMGNFCSSPFGQHPGDRDAFRKRFDDLADLICAFDSIASGSQFVLIPGPNDPGAARILPRQSLPPFFCERLLDKHLIPHLTLATNPCRIRYFTQEIVFFRNDVSNRLQRRAIVPPQPTETDVQEHVSGSACYTGRT